MACPQPAWRANFRGQNAVDDILDVDAYSWTYGGFLKYKGETTEDFWERVKMGEDKADAAFEELESKEEMDRAAEDAAEFDAKAEKQIMAAMEEFEALEQWEADFCQSQYEHFYSGDDPGLSGDNEDKDAVDDEESFATSLEFGETEGGERSN